MSESRHFAAKIMKSHHIKKKVRKKSPKLVESLRKTNWSRNIRKLLNFFRIPESRKSQKLICLCSRFQFGELDSRSQKKLIFKIPESKLQNLEVLEEANNLPLSAHLNLFHRNFDHIVVDPGQAHLHLGICTILLILLIYAQFC